MSDRETTELFIEESLEGLQQVEAALLASERGEAPRGFVDALFRDFHTIKGTAGFLGFAQIGALAHRAEDLLGAIRDRVQADPSYGRAEQPDDPVLELTVLVGVVDALRAMVGCVREIDEEGEHDIKALLEEVSKATKQVIEGAKASQGVPKPAPSEAPAAEHHSEPPEEEPKEVQPNGPPLLGEVLLKGGHITQAQLDAALASQRAYDQANREAHSGAGPAAAPPKLGEILVAQGAITEARLAVVLETQRDQRAKTVEGGEGTVRVNVGVLDKLMNLMGELVLARNQATQLLRSVKDTVSAQAAAQRLVVVSSEIQEQIMKTRMQPVSRVFEKLPRMVRDLCKWTGKEATCQINGTTTEIDKALAEAIRDPVMHIVRNAMDHGIETPEVRASLGKPARGTLTVRAFHDGGLVTIEISDDGAGMDPEKIKAHAVRRGVLSLNDAERLSPRQAIDLIFRPGFSTADKVTDISGRGVGMDVVRSHVEKAGGQVDIESVAGVGTTIRLKMPLTMAIIPALLVGTGARRFAIPQVNLLELVHLDTELYSDVVEQVRGAEFYRLRGEILPLIALDRVLNIPEAPPTDRGRTIVVVQVASSRYGLIVDSVFDTEEIVIKPLHRELKKLSVYSGAAVLGDGTVALILDVAGLGALGGVETSCATEAPFMKPSENEETETHLLFRAGQGQTCAVPLGLVARLEQVFPSTIEKLAGRDVVQYQGSIMPILRPEELLPIGPAPERQPGSVQQLIVFDFGHKCAMAVQEILDIVTLQEMRDFRQLPTPHTFGHRVIGGTSTLILDVYSMISQVAPDYARERPVERARRRILLADDSPTMRAAVSGLLRAVGLEVVEVPNGRGALNQLNSPVFFDAVVTDIEMEGVDGFAVLDYVRQHQPMTPVFLWTRHDEPAMVERARLAGATACVSKARREELVQALISFGILEKAKEAA
ncbi:MAG: chemotaxis protein CheW [Myxococcota bacterium]